MVFKGLDNKSERTQCVQISNQTDSTSLTWNQVEFAQSAQHWHGIWFKFSWNSTGNDQFKIKFSLSWMEFLEHRPKVLSRKWRPRNRWKRPVRFVSTFPCFCPSCSWSILIFRKLRTNWLSVQTDVTSRRAWRDTSCPQEPSRSSRRGSKASKAPKWSFWGVVKTNYII